MARQFPRPHNQIGQDVGVYRRKNILPVKSISMSCLGPDWSWGGGAPSGFAPPRQQQGCFKLCVEGGPLKGTEAAPAHIGSTLPHSVTTVLQQRGQMSREWHFISTDVA